MLWVRRTCTGAWAAVTSLVGRGPRGQLSTARRFHPLVPFESTGKIEKVPIELK